MDRIVLATWGSYGDLHPFISLALELKECDYVPVIACSEQYRQKIISEGIEFAAVRPDDRDTNRKLSIDQADVIERYSAPGTSGLEFIVQAQLLPYLRDTYEDMRHVAADARLIVTSTFAYGATLASESLQLPYVNVALQPVVFGGGSQSAPSPVMHHCPDCCVARAHPASPSDDVPLRRRVTHWSGPIHALRSEIGLAPAIADPIWGGQFSPYANIGLYSAVLGCVEPHFPPRTTIAGFALYDREIGNTHGDSAEINHFLASGSAPLVFALGSQAVHAPGDFFRIGADVARQLRMRSILVTGATRMEEPLPNTLSVSYARYSELFGRAAAIIHHGGIGTTGQALYSGRPQLIVPFFGDQYDNAKRVVSLGVGRTILRSNISVESVSSELNTLLTHDDYAKRADIVAGLVRQEAGPAAAVRVISDVLELHSSALRKCR